MRPTTATHAVHRVVQAVPRVANAPPACRAHCSPAPCRVDRAAPGRSVRGRNGLRAPNGPTAVLAPSVDLALNAVPALNARRAASRSPTATRPCRGASRRSPLRKDSAAHRARNRRVDIVVLAPPQPQ